MNTNELAREFSRQLLATLTVEQLAYVIDGNSRETDPNICHSHDHVDANEVMLAAWMVLEPAMELDGILNDDANRAVWADAWSLAKQAGFDAGKIA